MSNSLADVLGNKDFAEPPEISAIKRYVMERYSRPVRVQIRQNDIAVIVPSASLAATLRMELPQLQQAAATDKKIFLRISH